MKNIPVSSAALVALSTLQLVMLGALFSQTPPHPPLAVAPFALGPFLGAAVALALSGALLGSTSTRIGTVTALLAVAFALVSFGPHKWFDPAFAQIWPAVVLGQAASVAVIVETFGRFARKGAAQ